MLGQAMTEDAAEELDTQQSQKLLGIIGLFPLLKGCLKTSKAA